MNNPLTALPPKVRAIVYYVYAVIGVVLMATQAGFAAAALGMPVQLAIAFAVYATLGAGFGLTAASNTPINGARRALED